MRRVLLMIILFLPMGLYACPMCKKQQPVVIRSVTHGMVPQTEYDYVIVVFAMLIVLVSLFYFVKWLVKPGECDPTHIKRSIFIEDRS